MIYFAGKTHGKRMYGSHLIIMNLLVFCLYSFMSMCFRALQEAPYTALMGVVVDGRQPPRVSIISEFNTLFVIYHS